MKRPAHIFHFLFITMFCFSLKQTVAQDLHFSQFMNAPLMTNPANAGFIPEADYRIGGHYRSQWTSLPAPFTTASVFGDFQMLRNKLNNGWMGIGFLVLHDAAGRGKLTKIGRAHV